MFDIGWPELALILVVALLLFGPSRMEEVARSVGKSIKAFKSGMKEAFDESEPKEKK